MAQDGEDRLGELRARIDIMDEQLVDVLAHRFEVTREVGRLKASRGLPSRDERRESAQRERLRELAAERGIDPDTVMAVFEIIVTQVRAEHEAARREARPSS
jgi:chorismate mutase